MADKKIVIQQDDQDFQTVLICAVRYSLGRRTYMPGLVTDWIRGYCNGKLSGKTIDIMRRDIDDQDKRKALGDECDIKTWRNFKAWLDGGAGNA